MEIFIAVNSEDVTLSKLFSNYDDADDFIRKAKEFGIDFKISKATLDVDIGANPYQVEVWKDAKGEIRFDVMEAETAHDFISSFKKGICEMKGRVYFTLFAKDKQDAIEQVNKKYFQKKDDTKLL